MKKLFKIFLTIFFIIVLAFGYIWYSYSQMYVQDGTDTATQGIFLKKTLNLAEYRRVSSGNDFWGKYDRYSRSDRHSEALTVYCKIYCSDK